MIARRSRRGVWSDARPRSAGRLARLGGRRRSIRPPEHLALDPVGQRALAGHGVVAGRGLGGSGLLSRRVLRCLVGVPRVGLALGPPVDSARITKIASPALTTTSAICRIDGELRRRRRKRSSSHATLIICHQLTPPPRLARIASAVWPARRRRSDPGRESQIGHSGPSCCVDERARNPVPEPQRTTEPTPRDPEEHDACADRHERPSSADDRARSGSGAARPGSASHDRSHEQSVAEVPQPSEPATPVVPSAPVTPAVPDPGTPAAPEEPATVPGPDEPAAPIAPNPGPDEAPEPERAPQPGPEPERTPETQPGEP